MTATMTIWKRLASMTAVAAFFCMALPAPADSGPTQFELTIGDKTYPVTEDQPFTVDGPNGAGVQAVLHAKSELSFHQYGLSFTYPKAVRVSAAEDQGTASINIDTPGNYLMMIEILPGIVTADSIKGQLQQAFEAKYQSMGAKYSKTAPETTERTMAGFTLKSPKTAFYFNGEQYRQEVYAFTQNGQTVAVSLQYTLDELKSSEANTSTILGSMTTYPRQ